MFNVSNVVRLPEHRFLEIYFNILVTIAASQHKLTIVPKLDFRRRLV